MPPSRARYRAPPLTLPQARQCALALLLVALLLATPLADAAARRRKRPKPARRDVVELEGPCEEYADDRGLTETTLSATALLEVGLWELSYPLRDGVAVYALAQTPWHPRAPCMPALHG